MTTPGLRISIGQCASPGLKPIQQDHHGAHIPSGSLLSTKGVALAMADGISSSSVSQEASQTAVQGFLSDYFDTAETWSVQRAGRTVITALNGWLQALNQRSSYRYDRDKGYACTFSALVLKSRTAHVLHVGDSRIYRLLGQSLEPLTQDHRVHINSQQSYLARALGMADTVEVDYRHLPLSVGDVFLLTTDGVHDFMDGTSVAQALATHGDNLDAAAQNIVDNALAQGSQDNLSCVIARVDSLPAGDANEITQQALQLPIPPMLAARSSFEGFTIVRTLHDSHRSHIYLAKDEASGQTVVLKAPATDLQTDPEQMDRFALEEWMARRITSPHVLKPVVFDRPRQHLFAVMEHVQGQTLAQWMVDNPRPSLEVVRGIVEQIAKGLQAFHRLEMLHQDLRPENIMIDTSGTVKIIDFGSVHVAGVAESVHGPDTGSGLVGTLQFAAPEYFFGDLPTPQSDLFSLAVMTYMMLTGRLPYGANITRVRSRSDLAKLNYQSAVNDQSHLPAWVDDVLRRALHPQPNKRHEALSQFVQELRQPPAYSLHPSHTPLVARNPLLFWKLSTLVLALTVVGLLAALSLQMR